MAKSNLPTRKQALKTMLRPITWHPSSSIYSRQHLVMQRRRDVIQAMPFMTPAEKRQAKQWLVDEAHDGLWD